MKHIYKILFSAVLVLAIGCDEEDFADLNSNPEAVAVADLRFSTAQAIQDMYSNDYTVWFYSNFDYIFPWSQLTTASVTGGNSEAFVEMGPAGGQSIYPSLYANARDIRARIEALPEGEGEEYRAMSAMTFPIVIHPAITITDTEGSMVYTEGALAPYTSPPLITPKYDNQETLFNTWLSELDAAIVELSAPNQFNIGSQDIIYNGDYQKWAKFCNLLKLKIAARLINKDRAKALSIAEEVASSSVGYMNTLDDDFIYRRDINYRGTGNGQQPGIAGKNIVDFMLANQDPRLRVIYTKNHFNAEVVQAFLDADKELPPYVEQYVTVDGEGNFAGWSGPGEPWVRYAGAPLSPDETFDTDNTVYFNQGELYRLSAGDVQKQYTATSSYTERITRTGFNFTYPTKPGGRVMEIIDNFPPLEVILGSSAETNLYLAEFKLLGANIPGTAQDYFNQGVRLSVERLDRLAKNSGLPYYEEDPVYTDETMAAMASTKLKAGEIEALLAQPAYDLSIDGLEKVYIQQYINHAGTPNDVWTTVRRSGIPKINSIHLPREIFTSSGRELTVPRRFVAGTPTEDNKNFPNQIQAVEEQGFSTGTNDPVILNTERLWFDEENPDYGAGPKE
ncbi:SusD/RagB family nutrient-binding outer membrane lipoprotein [Cytophaga sp. FL35]|uniref:SusD/RagB family nutrient-binding outer membrane lipoprotein n=1 Tax=Cytophaga sp. FL35 TaxID=1904456 RepID=UPI001653A17B|nr:SusD/RagB family nutrient-binding outer membrane lipoprotein [Cytophaga sp. FL35]MBC6999820.1 SusD/RagB family nutrient-binding outer membrane lipoprotein [Cytophaga sp. FL35]